MSINSRFITFGLDDTLSRSEQNIASFVDKIDRPYHNPNLTGSGNQLVQADIDQHPFIGSFTDGGAYDVWLNQASLSSKLNTRNPITELSTQSIITDSFEYSKNIYGILGISTYNSRTYVGDLATVNSSWQLDRLQAHTMPSVSRLGGNDALGMRQLGQALQDVNTRLHSAGIQSTLTQRKDGFIELAVPEVGVLQNGSIQRTTDQYSASDQLKFKRFTFTATRFGVIEAGSNRYINQSVVRTPVTTHQLSAYNTAAMLVETYVRMGEVVLDQATSLAFRTFMEAQQRLGANQTYIEVDRYLGNVVGGSSFTQVVNQFNRSGDIQAFNQMQLALREALIQTSERDQRVYSQVSKDTLSRIRDTQITNILKPLSANSANRAAASAQVIQNFARVMMTPYTAALEGAGEVRLDPFTALKQQILQQSSGGAAVLRQQVKSLQTKTLEQLYAPYLQPHSTNYSAGQLGARRIYYSTDAGPLARPGLESVLMATAATYSHGGRLPAGRYNVPISAQSAGTLGQQYQARYTDSQFSQVSTEALAFFDNQTLFTSTLQLELTSLAQLKRELLAIGYGGTNDWLAGLQSKLRISDDESDEAQILLVPFKKPEQIPQRLKNITGARNAVQYSFDYYQAALAQKDLSAYRTNDGKGSIDRGRTLSGNLATVLPKTQFERVQELQGQGLAGAELLSELRNIEANPFDLGGIVGAEYQKRVLIPTGLTQTSDFMHINAAHTRQAVYGYEQFTKVELESITEHNVGGTKLYSSNIALDQQRALYQQAFQPGRYIYYAPTVLRDAGIQAQLTEEYEALRQQKQYVEQQGNQARAYKDITQQLMQRHRYLDGVSMQQGQLQFTLKAGLYGYDQNTFKNFGLFDQNTARLVIGLAARPGANGELALAQSMAVKISGTLRKDQKGVAVVNDQIGFSELGGRLIGTVSYTTLFDPGGIRPATENVKGPGRIDTSVAFDYHDQVLSGADQYYSERTLAKPIYAIANAATFKGFNYESGLDILAHQGTYERVRDYLQQDALRATALLATYFSSDLSKYSTESFTEPLKQASIRLRSQIAGVLTNTDLERQLGQAVQSGRIAGDLTKSSTLFTSNAGLFALIADAPATPYAHTDLEPRVQLQRTLLKALSSPAEAQQFIGRVVGIFEQARSAEHSLTNGDDGYTTFNQSSSTVRAASVLANLFGLSYQSIGYAQARRSNPLAQSVLELGLVDPTGRINVNTLLGRNTHSQVMDLFIRAKGAVPSAHAVARLTQAYEAIDLDPSRPLVYSLAERDRYAAAQLGLAQDPTYQQLASTAANIYALSQASIPLQISTKILPSKILQAAGSKDISNLEYHYTIAMSKRSVDRLRGYVADLEQVNELTHAYHILVNFNQSKGLGSGLRFLSAFNSDRTKLYRQTAQFMDLTSTLATQHLDVNYQYAQALVRNDSTAMRALGEAVSHIKYVGHSYLGAPDQLAYADRARALAILSDSRRAGVAKEQSLTQTHRLSQQTNFDLTGATKIFFDIETSDLVDPSKAIGDRTRYPQQINELAFIVRAADGTTLQEYSYSKGQGSLTDALKQLSGVIKNNADAVLVGHNIRAFDIPTLRTGLEQQGVNYQNLRLVDTYADVDLVQAHRSFGLTKFNLSTVYKFQSLYALQQEAINADPARQLAIQQQIASGQYGEYAAHEALADVRANIEVFNFIERNNLFRARTAPTTGLEQPGVLNKALNKFYYFNAVQDTYSVTGDHQLFPEVLKLAQQVITDANGKDLLYQMTRYADQYTSRATAQGGFAADLIYDYTLNLLMHADVTNERGLLRNTSKKGTVPVIEFLTSHAIKHDRRLEALIESSLGDNDATYVDSLQNLAKNLLDVRTEHLYRARQNPLDPSHNIAAARAQEAYLSVYKSHVVPLPFIAFDDSAGVNNIKARFVAAGGLSNAPMHGNSLMLFGLDVLNQLPKDYETFTPEVIRHRRQLDRVLPEYFEVVEHIRQQQAQGRDSYISGYQRNIIDQVNELAVVNREIAYDSAAGAMAQRAYGEREKHQGVSATAVASYLTHIDELTLGSRYQTNGIAYNNRAGGLSGASAVDQAVIVKGIADLNTRARAQGSMVQIDVAENRTTALMALAGRFGAQGGDFDGDSYGVISAYQETAKRYAELQRQRNDLTQTIKHIARPLIALDLLSTVPTANDLDLNQVKSLLAANESANLLQTVEKIEDRNQQRGVKAYERSRAQTKALANYVQTTWVPGDIDNTEYRNTTDQIWARLHKLGLAEQVNAEVTKRVADATKPSMVQARVEEFMFDPANKWLGEHVKNQSYDVLRKTMQNRAFQGNQYAANLLQQYNALIDQGESYANRQEFLYDQFKTNADAGYTTDIINSIKSKLTYQDYDELHERSVDRAYVTKRMAERAEGEALRETYMLMADQFEGQDHANAALEQGRAYAKEGVYNYLNKVTGGLNPEADRDYINYLKQQVTAYEAQATILDAQLVETKRTLDQLDLKTDQIAARAVNSMRRHVAGYIGLPEQFLSAQLGVFHSAEVFNMIEQQRGITPNLDDAQSVHVNKGGALRAQATNLLADISSRPAFAQGGASIAAQGREVNRILSQSPDVEAAAQVRAYINKKGLDAFSQLDPTQRLNDFFLEQDDSSLADAFNAIAKMTSNAGGTALSDRAFTGLQAAIGSSGTSLIGEAYNAITTLMSRTILARTVSESFGPELARYTGVETGIDSSAALPAEHSMFGLTKASFERMFPADFTDGLDLSPEQKQNMQSAHAELVNVFNNPQQFAQAALTRAQTLTGLLGNVQQAVRDSLKAKQEGGMLESLLATNISKQGKSLIQILGVDDTTEDQRFDAMRVFLGEEAGEAIFNIKGESRYENRAKVTAFGALFLMSDFMNTSDGGFDRLIYPTAKRDDALELVRYRFLEERYKRIELQQGELARDATSDADRYRLGRYDDMLSSSKDFVAQSVVDLLNISIAQRRAYEAAFSGKDDAQNLDYLKRMRLTTMAALGNEDAITQLQRDYQADTTNIRLSFNFTNDARGAAYREDIAASLYLDPHGNDLLAGANTYMQDMGIDPTRADAELEFYKRNQVQFFYTYQQYNGLTKQDVFDARANMQATNYLRFDVLEGSTTFKNFLDTSAAASDALMTQLTRDQITDPKQMSAVVYDAGAQLFEAMGELHTNLEGMYGTKAVEAMAHPGINGESAVPLSTLRAYRSAQSIMGVFNHMFSQAAPEVAQHAAQMFGMSLVAKNAQGESGYTQLGNLLAGMAQVQMNELSLYRATNQDPSAIDPEAQEMLKQYQEAIGADRAAQGIVPDALSPDPINTGAVLGVNTKEFLMQTGRTIRRPKLTPVELQDQVMEQHKQSTAQARTSLLSALVAPAFLSLVGSDIEPDVNLANRGYDFAQAAAQVSELYNPTQTKFNSAALFQIDRIQKNLKAEGAVFGSVRALTSELLFEATSRLAHQIFAPKGTKVGTVAAELVSASIGLALAGWTSGRKYGALDEDEEQYQRQAFFELPQVGVGIASNIVEEFLNSNTLDNQDEEISYDATVNPGTSEFQASLESNWARLDIYDEFGNEADVSFSMDDYAASYSSFRAPAREFDSRAGVG